MAKVTHLVDQVWRYTESVAPTSTTDFHIYNRVAGASTSARTASATTLATAQLVNMRNANSGRGSACVLISTSESAL